jgi:acyl-CoA synthetase (AMP-forming)/AMP-acid ligase II
MNLMMLLEMASSAFGERVAITSGHRSLSHAELFGAAGRAAHEIQASGAEHVAYLEESELALPVSLFASAWAGVPFVPLSYRKSANEVESLLRRVRPALLLTDAARCQDLAGLEDVTTRRCSDFLAAATAPGDGAAEWRMDPEETAVLLFTSGTSGAPKAAVLRHKHLVSYVLGSVEFMSASEEDASLVCVPPYHIAGVAALCSSIYAGRRIVQLPHFSAEAWLETAQREKVTHAFVVPTMLSRIVASLERKGRADLAHLRALSYGGGRMPLPVIERAMRLLPHADFTNAYGLTETSSTISLLGPDDHRDAAASEDPGVRRRLASVGRPLPTLEVEIRDARGKALAAGEPGEILVRGEQVSGEYLERGSDLTDGWFPTRDAGFLDAEGYLFVEGRIDDVIVRGGENLSPGEIEDVLREHAAVAEAAVVGIPDEQWGEAVAAAVVLAEGQSTSPQALQDLVRARLRSSRVPERIEFWAELPYNETGKLLRRCVRDKLAGPA